MKNKIILSVVLAAMLMGCSKEFLREQAVTDLTVDKLWNTPEGLATAVVALYAEDRRLLRVDGESDMWLQMERGTDITVSRTGSGNAAMAQYNNTDRQANLSWSNTIWRFHYNIIGKANEVVFYGERLGVSNPAVARSVAEARFFRAQSYFWLYRLFERIFVNTIPTTPDNVNDERVFRPSTKDEVFRLLKEDLDFAIANLPPSAGSQPGRLTTWAARHVRADVALWDEDWNTAITHCEAIVTQSPHRLIALADVFAPNGADLNHAEAIYTWQWANRPGGAPGAVSLQGHRLMAHYIPSYHNATGTRTFLNGGYGWGRVFPNTYMFSLYNTPTDQRRSLWYKEHFIYDDPAFQNRWPAGTRVGDTVKLARGPGAFFERAHPGCLKFFDRVSVGDPFSAVSFKDVMIYRLAETHLFAAEAYMRAGNQPKALEHYNKTWTRAGNPPFTGTVTLELIMDEQAREMAFELKRWNFLKRIGKLAEQVRAYTGDTDLNAALGRTQFRDFHVRWPIHQTVLDQLGRDNFPQNPGYN